jgi:hypothetical protein
LYLCKIYGGYKKGGTKRIFPPPLFCSFLIWDPRSGIRHGRKSGLGIKSRIRNTGKNKGLKNGASGRLSPGSERGKIEFSF